MKRFVAVLAVVSISAIAGEPTVTGGTAPAEKKTITPTVLRGAGSGSLGTTGTGGLGTGASTKPAKPKTATPPVGTK